MRELVRFCEMPSVIGLQHYIKLERILRTVTSRVFEGGAGCTKVGKSERSRDSGDAFRFCDMEPELDERENGGVVRLVSIMTVLARLRGGSKVETRGWIVNILRLCGSD